MTRTANVKCWRNSALSLLLLAALYALPVPASAASIQVGFSPEGSAQALVLDVIDSANHDIRVMAYAFTARDITKALVTAHKRGVDVRVVVDKDQSEGRYMTSALNTLVTAGIPVRTNDDYKIMHDKAIIVDGQTTQTGSFNYSHSAETANSENVIVIWNYPEVAQAYLGHWQSRWAGGTAYHTPY